MKSSIVRELARSKLMPKKEERTETEFDNDLDLHSFELLKASNLVVISGAGIAGLAAAFELLRRGYEVIIVEKRESFVRFNVINLDVEAQQFLKRFDLLQEFEEKVGARISEHRLVHIHEDAVESLGINDVRGLESSDIPIEPSHLVKLFKQDGLYSVRLKDLQNFLARRAVNNGAKIFFNSEVEITERRLHGGVNQIRLINKENPDEGTVLNPHLFFIAEGAHSKTACELGFKKIEVETVCTGESWIFGNVTYFGDETIVLSVIDTREDLEIANVILNAKLRTINVSVTACVNLSPHEIKERIIALLDEVLKTQNIYELAGTLAESTKEPVYIRNEKRETYSRDNVFCIGDATGHSSPLAGMGGTLALTVTPRMIDELLDYYEAGQKDKAHQVVHEFSEAAVDRWINKSASIKNYANSKRSPLLFSGAGNGTSSNDESHARTKKAVL